MLNNSALLELLSNPQVLNLLLTITNNLSTPVNTNNLQTELEPLQHQLVQCLQPLQSNQQQNPNNNQNQPLQQQNPNQPPCPSTTTPTNTIRTNNTTKPITQQNLFEFANTKTELDIKELGLIAATIDPFVVNDAPIPFTQLLKEPSERLRYYAIHGQHIPGISNSEKNYIGNYQVEGVNVYRVKQIRHKKERIKLPKELTEEELDYILNSDGLDVNQFKVGSQLKQYQLVPPIPLRKLVIKYFHDSKTNHAGMRCLNILIAKKYWWYNLKNDIADYCNACTFVQKGEGFVGYVMIIEGFSKYTWGTTVKNKSADTVDRFLRATLDNIRTLYKVDFEESKTRLRHDCGKEFENHTIANTLVEYKIINSATNPYSPAENGITERPNCTIKDGIDVQMQRGEESWVQAFDTSMFNYNNHTIHSVTGEIPIELLRKVAPSSYDGCLDRRSIAINKLNIQNTIENITAKFEKQAARHNAYLKRKFGEVTLQEKQLVLVSRPPYAKNVKLDDKMKRIAQIISETAGHKFMVKWGRTGGYVKGEKPFTTSKHPIDPKYFSCRYLGCDHEVESFDEGDLCDGYTYDSDGLVEECEERDNEGHDEEVHIIEQEPLGFAGEDVGILENNSRIGVDLARMEDVGTLENNSHIGSTNGQTEQPTGDDDGRQMEQPQNNVELPEGIEVIPAKKKVRKTRRKAVVRTQEKSAEQ